MASSQNVGQTTPLSIRYLDTNGQPMPVDPVLDATPAWSQTNAAAETLTPSSDGKTCADLGVAAGSDTVKVDLSVGGRSFSATIDMTVNAVGPALGSIEIVAGTRTP